MSVPYHPPVKGSVTVAGHQTSISLEPVFWTMLRGAAAAQGVSVNALIARIDAERIRAPRPPGLASAVRVWLVAGGGSGQDAPGDRPRERPGDREGEGSG